MNRTIASLLTGAVLSAMCLAQSSTAGQADAAAAQDTSVSANKSGAKAGSNTSANTSQETAVTGKNGQAQAASAGQMQSGSTVQAELTKPVDARKCKRGDEVAARTTQDVKSDGRTVLPKGSKLVGHVTDVQAREKGQPESHIGIAFERAILKNGTQVPMALTLQAIGNAQTNEAATMDDATMAGDNMSGVAARAGAAGSGTARGAVVRAYPGRGYRLQFDLGPERERARLDLRRAGASAGPPGVQVAVVADVGEQYLYVQEVGRAAAARGRDSQDAPPGAVGFFFERSRGELPTLIQCRHAAQRCRCRSCSVR